MSPGRLRESVITRKAEIVREMLSNAAALPLGSLDDFTDDPRTVAAAESFLRRSLEALLDLGRHLLAKGFGEPTSEYKAIPVKLRDAGVLDPDLAALFVEMAGYRNRLTHFYEEVTPQELHRILTQRRGEVEAVLAALLSWVNDHPGRVDRSL